MKDPIDLLGSHPVGALERRPDSRDYQFDPKEIAQASAPFSWQEGNGPDPALVALYTIKNQGNSYSCGGQAFSYYGQRLRNVYANDLRERSAKYPYSQVFVPGGGSSDRDLANIAIKQGFGLETDTPSYQQGMVPSEIFMERPQDITSTARIGAAKDQASFAYAFPDINIDSIAQAASACLGAVIGIWGENNGTWLSTVPAVAKTTAWAHYMHVAQPQIYQGKKGFWSPQSWGKTVGEGGWQFITEDHFTAGMIWAATVLIYNPAPVQPPRHTFNINLKLGDQNDDVMALQQYLAYDGEFNVAPTGFYGQITAQAVLKFQIKYGQASVATLEELGGDTCGPATRQKLNGLI
jgi:hypothetical protein